MKSQSVVQFGQPLEETVTDTPSPSGAEVLVRVGHCGVCHSDVHIHDGYFELGDEAKLDLSRGRQLPFTLGHEIAGEVVACGPDVTGVSPGERKVIYPWIGCGTCPICESGNEHLCNAPRALGVALPGGFSDHVLVPNSKYLIDYGDISESLAATYMCSGLTAYGALKKLANVGEDDQVMVVGLGGVGMMGLQFAKALFKRPPLGADIDEAKLAAGAQGGAAKTYNSADAATTKSVLTDTGGVAGVVDFVGSEASLNFATSIVRKGGQVVIVGLFGGAFSMPIPMFPLRAISIGGSFVGSLAQTHEMMALVRAGKIQPIPVEERPLAQAGKTLNDLRAGKIIGRVVLKP
jgi:D-arabinose 1-dehydrogenase-like Zn-dependent alcohol dehydrogenase